MPNPNTPYHLTSGDLVRYESTTYGGGEPEVRTRAAIISSVIDADIDLVSVRYADVNPESGGGFDYDSGKRYTRIDREEFDALMAAEAKREAELWAAQA